MLEEEKRAPTRREFSAKVSVLGLAAALFPALLSTPAHAAKPKKDGRFPAGVTGFTTTNTLDPALLDDIGYHFINWGLRNNLVEVDYKGEAIPELAESWEATSDAPWNNSHFHHARFDKLLRRPEPSGIKRNGQKCILNVSKSCVMKPTALRLQSDGDLPNNS